MTDAREKSPVELVGELGQELGELYRKELDLLRAEIDEKIASLKRIRRALTRLAEHCPGHGPLSDCPILDALEGRENRRGTQTKGARR